MEAALQEAHGSAPEVWIQWSFPHTPFHTQCARLVSLHLEPPFLCCVCRCTTYQMYLERARAVLYAVGDTSSPGLAARVCSGVRIPLSLRCRTC
jgi:hypothetical protein